MSATTSNQILGINGPTDSLAASNRYAGCTAWVRLEQMEPWPGVKGKYQGQRPLEQTWVKSLANHFKDVWFAPTVFPMVGIARFEDAHLPLIPTADSNSSTIPAINKTLKVYNISGNHRCAAMTQWLKSDMRKQQLRRLRTEGGNENEITDQMVLQCEEAKWPMIIFRQGEFLLDAILRVVSN